MAYNVRGCWRGSHDEWVKVGKPLPANVDGNYDCDKPEQWPQNRKYTMTREEAIAKVKHIAPLGGDLQRSPGLFIELLEALGLIKFDDVSEYKVNSVANQIGYTYWHLQKRGEVRDLTAIGNDFVKDLEAAGYRIVKLGQFTKIEMEHGNYHQGHIQRVEQS